MISVTVNQDSYKNVQNTLRSLRTKIPKAAVSAMSKSLTQVKKIMVDETYNVLNLSKGRITEDITAEIKGNIEDGNLDTFKMAVKSSGRPVGLIQFSKQSDSWDWKNPTPIKVRIYRQSGQTHVFKHTFIAKGKGTSTSKRTHDVKGHMWERDKKIRMGRPYVKGRAYWALPHHYKFPLKRMTTIRIQDIQDKPKFIATMYEKGSTIILKAINVSIDGVFTELK